jgi:iron complex transport system ATP-binding protein
MPGQFTYLLGPNGAGKSTLLRTLVGSQPSLDGRILLNGQDLHRLSSRKRAQQLSVVLTDRVDVGMLTVRALVGLGRAPHTGWFSVMDEDDRNTVEWALKSAGADALAHRQVAELSDGERQRVLIARALAQRPSVLVLDEPTAFLDLTRRVELIALLRRLVDETALAVLMSTHDLDLALRTADQIWLVHRDSTFETGGPEDLAFKGSITRAYAGEGIIFDHAAGTFMVRGPEQGPRIAISGDPIAAQWATRAAQRSGFLPVGSSAQKDCSLSVQADPKGDADWTLVWGGFHLQGSGFASLIGQLRLLAEQHFPT